MQNEIQYHIHNCQYDYRYRHDEKEVVRAAARMQPFILHCVLRGKLVPCLIAGDGLMLRTVIHEKPLGLLHCRTKEQITYIDSNPKYTLNERTPNPRIASEDQG